MARRASSVSTNYCAAKSGVIGFTRALALESARKGITVNAIAPGYVKTDLLAGVSEDVMKAIVGQIPVGRLGEADEVGRCVVFLAADEAGWITGSTPHHQWRPVHGLNRGSTGSKPSGASSKPAKSKPGATVQPVSVHAPRLWALCQTPAGTSTCGCSPLSQSGPSV